MTDHDEAHEHLDGYCVDALRELYLYLDGELTVERRVTIEVHLNECSPCMEKYEFEEELRIGIRKVVQGVEPAPEFRGQLLGMIDQLVEADRQSNPGGG